MLTLLQYAYIITICLRYYNMLTLLQYTYVITICLHYYNMLTLLQYAYVIANLTARFASRRINVVSAASSFSGLETTLCLLYIDCTMVKLMM